MIRARHATFRWAVAAAIVVVCMQSARGESPTVVPRASSQATSSQAAEQGGKSLEQGRIGARDRSGTRGGVMDWVQPVAALAIVVVLIFVLRAVLRRLGGRARIAGGGQCVEVVGRQHLSPRCEVLLVRCGKRLLLVGLGAGGPVTLCEISDPQEAAALLGETSGAGGGPVRDVAERIRSRLSSGPKVEG